MEKQFVPYELALKLKELGFDEECLAVWDNQTKELFLNDTRDLSIKKIPTVFTLATTWSQAFDWMLNEKMPPLSSILFMNDWSGNIELADRKKIVFISREECLEKIIEISVKSPNLKH